MTLIHESDGIQGPDPKTFQQMELMGKRMLFEVFNLQRKFLKEVPNLIKVVRCLPVNKSSKPVLYLEKIRLSTIVCEKNKNLGPILSHRVLRAKGRDMSTSKDCFAHVMRSVHQNLEDEQ